MALPYDPSRTLEDQALRNILITERTWAEAQTIARQFTAIRDAVGNLPMTTFEKLNEAYTKCLMLGFFEDVEPVRDSGDNL